MTATTETVAVAGLNPNVVILKDADTPFGKSVDFGVKNKTQVITEIVATPEAGGETVKMFWAYRNGNVTTLEFFVPAGGRTLAATEQAFGIQQKIGDSYAQVKDADDVQLIVEVTLDNLKEGRWAKQSTGSAPGIAGLSSELIEGVRRTFAANDKAEYADLVEGKALAKSWLIVKYNAVLDAANEMRKPTGNDVQDAANAKEADAMTKNPFKRLLASADLQGHLATIRREKAEAVEAAKMNALTDAGISLADFE